MPWSGVFVGEFEQVIIFWDTNGMQNATDSKNVLSFY